MRSCDVFWPTSTLPEQVGRTPRGVRGWLLGKAIVREKKKRSPPRKRGPNSRDLRSVDPSNAEATATAGAMDKAGAAAATSSRERERQDQLRARRTRSQHAAAASGIADGDGKQLRMKNEEREVKPAKGAGNVKASWPLSALGAVKPAEGEDRNSIEAKSKDDGSEGAT